MIRVRPMREGDVHGVSAVRVNGWKAAYTGMVPQDYLDALTVTEDARVRRDMFGRGAGTAVHLVAEEDGAVVGWAALGPSGRTTVNPVTANSSPSTRTLTASAPESAEH